MLAFDELNVLNKSQGRKVMSIDRYFNEMELPEQEKKDRKEFARKLEDRLFLILAFIYSIIEYGALEQIPTAKSRLERDITDLFKEFSFPSFAIAEYIRTYSNDFVDSTINNANRYISDAGSYDEDVANAANTKLSYWFSQDRARLNAENEANTLFNYDQFQQAIADGYRYKQWIAMKDERVRLSHTLVDEVTIPIEDYFVVGDSLMRFPKDPEGDPEEIVGCRCTILFLKEFRISSDKSIETSLAYLAEGKSALDKRRKSILSKLPNSGDFYLFDRDKIKTDDLKYLSASAKHEFALFRSKKYDLLIHGTYYHCDFPKEVEKDVLSGKYEWIAHTHLDSGKLSASNDDRKVLKALGQKRSTLISARTGKMIEFADNLFDD